MLSWTHQGASSVQVRKGQLLKVQAAYPLRNLQEYDLFANIALAFQEVSVQAYSCSLCSEKQVSKRLDPFLLCQRQVSGSLTVVVLGL